MKRVGVLGCALAVLIGSAGLASAATITIVGDSYPTVTPFPGYGTAINQHNVVNSGVSDLTDGDATGSLWFTSDGTDPAGVTFTSAGTYQIDYFHVGAESGNTNQLSVGGTNPFTHNESNQNNNIPGGSNPGAYYVGSTLETVVPGPGSTFLDFLVRDLDVAGTESNGGSSEPGANVASLMYAYVQRTTTGWVLSAIPTNWFAFGFDDPGSSNDNHDDYVGIAYVKASNGQLTPPVPIPAPLALLLTGLFGLGFLGRWKAKLLNA